jgi:pentatricopeptide repeat protein
MSTSASSSRVHPTTTTSSCTRRSARVHRPSGVKHPHRRHVLAAATSPDDDQRRATDASTPSSLDDVDASTRTALARALSSVNAVRSGAREAFDALDQRAVSLALKALVDGGVRPTTTDAQDEDDVVGDAFDRDRSSSSSSSSSSSGSTVVGRVSPSGVKRACALIREVEAASLERGCATAVTPAAMEYVARAGSSIRGDATVTLAVTRAFYTVAKKGRGATSEAHATLRTYTDVIASLSRCAVEARESGAVRRTPSAVEIWLMLRATPLRLDGAAYAAGVGAYVSEGRTGEAERLLRDMTEDGVRAGPRLFNALIAGYGREKNLRGIETSAMAMRTLGVVPNQATWGAKVYAYVNCGRLDLALDALEQGIRFSPIPERRPGVRAYTALVQGLSRAGRVSEADEVIRRMARDGVKPNAYTYSTLIDGLVRSAQLGLAETALAEMRRAKIKPTVVTYNSLLKGLVRSMSDEERQQEDVLHRAKGIFADMRAEGLTPDLVSYNTLVDACIDAHAPNEAWSVLREISESGLKPDVVTYTTLLKYFAQVGDDSATRWVVKEMDADPNVVQDVGVYNCLISAYAKRGDMPRALEILETMQEKRIKPIVSTYGALVEGYIRLGDVREALNLYNKCVNSSQIAPDARMRKSIVYGCGLHGMSDVAECLIADLQATGPEGAKEAKRLSFVLKAATEDGASGGIRRRRGGKRKQASSSKPDRLAQIESEARRPSAGDSEDDGVPSALPAASNRGLEMWKFWLGLPNNYYEARADDVNDSSDASPLGDAPARYGDS